MSKITAEQLKDIKANMTHFENQSLIGSLWNTIRQVFISTSAASSWGSAVVVTEAAVARTAYLNNKLAELENLSKA